MRAALVAAVLCVGASCLADEGDAAKFKITTKKKDDGVEVKAEKDRTVFVVTSPSGISQAVIEREGEKWPAAVVLRLQLKGLENFRAANGKVTLGASVSKPGEEQKVRLWKDGKEDAPLDAKSPYYMDIRPPKDGAFEMTLPKAFFADNPKSITVNWIDFYRN